MNLNFGKILRCEINRDGFFSPPKYNENNYGEGLSTYEFYKLCDLAVDNISITTENFHLKVSGNKPNDLVYVFTSPFQRSPTNPLHFSGTIFSNSQYYYYHLYTASTALAGITSLMRKDGYEKVLNRNGCILKPSILIGNYTNNKFFKKPKSFEKDYLRKNGATFLNGDIVAAQSSRIEASFFFTPYDFFDDLAEQNPEILSENELSYPSKYMSKLLGDTSSFFSNDFYKPYKLYYGGDIYTRGISNNPLYNEYGTTQLPVNIVTLNYAWGDEFCINKVITSNKDYYDLCFNGLKEEPSSLILNINIDFIDYSLFIYSINNINISIDKI